MHFVKYPEVQIYPDLILKIHPSSLITSEDTLTWVWSESVSINDKQVEL